jgi:hypothetical protein
MSAFGTKDVMVTLSNVRFRGEHDITHSGSAKEKMVPLPQQADAWRPHQQRAGNEALLRGIGGMIAHHRQDTSGFLLPWDYSTMPCMELR